MSYIGRGVDAISNVEKLDNITFNGGTTYALTKSSAAFTPVGANNILVSIDGVIQQGNFSVSTTNIVFDWSPTSSNTCNFILHYGTGVLNVPADGSIVAAKMAANSVDSDSYVDGSIDAVHLSANSVDSDAYVDGSIDLAHMSSESVDEDNLHISNAGSNDQFLQKQSGNAGGLTWATAGGGKVLQVVNAETSVAASSSSSTLSDTGLTAAITPANTANKILIFVNQGGLRKVTGNTSGNSALLVDIAGGGYASLGNIGHTEWGNTASTARLQYGTLSSTVLHSPNSVGVVTYKTQFASVANIAQVDVQMDGTSRITLMELDYS